MGLTWCYAIISPKCPSPRGFPLEIPGVWWSCFWARLKHFQVRCHAFQPPICGPGNRAQRVRDDRSVPLLCIACWPLWQNSWRNKWEKGRFAWLGVAKALSPSWQERRGDIDGGVSVLDMELFTRVAKEEESSQKYCHITSSKGPLLVT